MRGGEERSANRDGLLLAVGSFDVYAKAPISVIARHVQKNLLPGDLRGFSKKMRNPN